MPPTTSPTTSAPQAGYRSIHMAYEVDNDNGSLRFKGMYFGGVIRYEAGRPTTRQASAHRHAGCSCTLTARTGRFFQETMRAAGWTDCPW